MEGSLQAELEAVKEALEAEKLKTAQMKAKLEQQESDDSSVSSPAENPPMMKRMYISHDRRLERFKDKPQKPGESSVTEWVADVKGQIASRNLPPEDQPAFILDHLAGKARREIVGRGKDAMKSAEAIFQVLLKVFGEGESLALLQQRFFSYKQREDEDLLTCSLELVDLYDRITDLDPSFKACREGNLKGRLAESTRDEGLRRELRRLNLEKPDLTFFEARDQALEWYGKGTKGRPRGAVSEEVTTEGTLTELLKEQSKQIMAQQEQIKQLLEAVSKLETRPPKKYSGPRRCFNCGSPDHLKRDCPEETKRGEGPKVNPSLN